MQYLKIVIVAIIIISLIILFRRFNSKKWDWAQIHSALPVITISPTNSNQIRDMIRANPLLPICIAGQKFSHGGQTMLDKSIYIDMRNFNTILKLDSKKKLITVQSGCTWEQIQNYLDPHDLSVAEMQSYRNFSVGGSICVNCHGRGIKYGTIADTIMNMKVMTSDGEIHNANLSENSDLFRCVIGSYGGIALILECTLVVEPNYPIEMQIRKTNRNEIINEINEIKLDNDVEFYNANIYPKNENEVIHITWVKTTKPLTTITHLQPKNNSYDFTHMGLEQLVRRFDIFKFARANIEPKMMAKTSQVVWKNYEMGYDTNQLEPLFRFPTTSILQEYFVPIKYTEKFLNDLFVIINNFKVNLLNLSLRYVKKTDIPILNYAPNDRVAFVLYLNIANTKESLNYAKSWTQILIDRAISYSGTFYLPYLLFASVSQFKNAYPNYKHYLKIKKAYDPNNRFRNHFIDKYVKELK